MRTSGAPLWFTVNVNEGRYFKKDEEYGKLEFAELSFFGLIL